jgi:uncharacterized protein (TIGR00251 family)
LSAAPQRPWWQGDACVIVRVRLTPKSSKDAIDGVEATADGPAFRARVRAVPAEGQANAAIERLLAEWLDVPRSCVALVSGQKSRVKSLRVAGEARELEALLNARLAGGDPG